MLNQLKPCICFLEWSFKYQVEMGRSTKKILCKYLTYVKQQAIQNLPVKTYLGFEKPYVPITWVKTWVSSLGGTSFGTPKSDSLVVYFYRIQREWEGDLVPSWILAIFKTHTLNVYNNPSYQLNAINQGNIFQRNKRELY